METAVPDGGWGWVVVASSFYFHLSSVGSLYSISVFYRSWVDDFKTGRGVTAWVITLGMAICVSTGPISALLGSRFGYRRVTISGAIIMSLGYLLSYFASSVYFLMVTIGLVSGFGLGLGYLPAIAALPSYFRKKRAIAVGIATSGVGFGAFIMPPFLTWLEEMYSWKGSMLILSGIVLNMCVGGALMRPVEHWVEVKTVALENGLEESVEENVCRVSESGTGVSENDEKCHFIPKQDEKGTCCKDASQVPNDFLARSNSFSHESKNPCENGDTHTKKEFSLNGHNTCPSGQVEDITTPPSCSFSRNNCSLNGEIHSKDRIGKEHSTACKSLDLESETVHSASCKSQIIRTDPRVKRLHQERNTKISRVKDLGGSYQNIKSDKGFGVSCHRNFSSVDELRRSPSEQSLGTQRRRENHISRSNSKPSTNTGSHNLDVMLSTGSIYNVFMLNKSLNSMMSLTSKAPTSRIPLDGSLLIEKNSDEVNDDAYHSEKAQSCCSKSCKSMKVYKDLLQNPRFLSMAFCNLLTNLSFLMPVVYMVDRAVDNGIEKSLASVALSMYGAGSLFGRIFMGWFTDRSFVDSLVCYILSLFICGAATCLSPLCGSEVALHAIYGLVFGFFIGGYVTMTPVVLVDIVGVDLVGQSYGLILAFQGVATAVGTPLAGLMFDWTQSYTDSFVIHGVLIIMAALILVPLKISILRTEKLQSQKNISAQIED